MSFWEFLLKYPLAWFTSPEGLIVLSGTLTGLIFTLFLAALVWIFGESDWSRVRITLSIVGLLLLVILATLFNLWWGVGYAQGWTT